jgi:1-acyl-sn-glycerol-3-phosphate acyltransferase
MIKKLSTTVLSIVGWRVEGQLPTDKKLLIIGAPHTSNWDFPLTLLALSALGLRFSWVAKHTLFKSPLGPLFRAIGGVPVNRKVKSGFLKGTVNAFHERDKLILAMAPEGTRSKTDHWKAGFYHIAVKANINICLGFIDYPSKTIGLGPIITPSKDIDYDFSVIKEFYQEKTGRYPAKQSEILLREKEIARYRKEFSRKT